MATTLNPNFERYFAYQSRFYPQIKEILKELSIHFVEIEIADEELDKKFASDFIVKVIDGSQVGTRVRGIKCTFRDWNIRDYCNGNRTEIHKLRDRLIKRYLMCWETSRDILGDYDLIDVEIANDLGLLDRNWTRHDNGDGTGFSSIPIAVLHEYGCIIAEQRAMKGDRNVYLPYRQRSQRQDRAIARPDLFSPDP